MKNSKQLEFTDGYPASFLESIHTGPSCDWCKHPEQPLYRAGFCRHCYRINREVAIYGNVSYNFLSSKAQEGPTASYISYTVGPRYYFTNPKLKSTIFLESGVGGYTFTQDEFSTTVEGVTTNFPEEGETRFGINAGIGGDIYMSDNVSLMLKAKYHLIMSGGDNARSFIGTDAGVNIIF